MKYDQINNKNEIKNRLELCIYSMYRDPFD